MSQNKSLKKEKFSIDVLMDENLIPEDLQVEFLSRKRTK